MSSYGLDALALKTTVDHDLAYYDREVTQDYLHAVEFTPLAQIDAPRLIAALQTLRQRRRQVKDLSLLLNAFDTAFDANRFWQVLNVSATGIKYQVRSAQAARPCLPCVSCRLRPKPIKAKNGNYPQRAVPILFTNAGAGNGLPDRGKDASHGKPSCRR